MATRTKVIFTDEEMSRVLSEHAAYVLRRGGGAGAGELCILQAAFNCPGVYPMLVNAANGRVAATRTIMTLFDLDRHAGWTPEELLAIAEGNP